VCVFFFSFSQSLISLSSCLSISSTSLFLSLFLSLSLSLLLFALFSLLPTPSSLISSLFSSSSSSLLIPSFLSLLPYLVVTIAPTTLLRSDFGNVNVYLRDAVSGLTAMTLAANSRCYALRGAPLLVPSTAVQAVVACEKSGGLPCIYQYQFSSTCVPLQQPTVIGASL
jgi:hypothetical protein